VHRRERPYFAELGFTTLSGTSVSERYTDSSGPGTMAITNEGSEPSVKGFILALTLTQNGVTFQGEGRAPQLAEGTFRLGLSLTNQQGNASTTATIQVSPAD